MKKKLENFKGVILKAIAKDIQLAGYSKLSTQELRDALVTELSKKEHKDFDFTKYEEPAAPGPSKQNVMVKPFVVPKARRRSVPVNSFGRR